MKNLQLPYKLLIFIGTVLVVAAIVYVVSNPETIVLNDTFRANHEGDFIKLSDGYTHYEFAGPDSGEVVVLIHGGGPSLWIWDRQITDLHEAGFKTLRFDRYGSGYSDRISGTYSWQLLIRQVSELLDSLAIDTPVILTGRSLGARIASCFTAQYPDRVSKLVLVSASLIRPKTAFISKVPLISYVPRFVKRVFGPAILNRMMKKYEHYLDDKDTLARYRDMLLEQPQIKGTEKAFGAIFGEESILGCSQVDSCLSFRDLPKAFIWGDNDKLVPPGRMKALQKKHPEIVFHQISNAGHGVNFTRAEQFNDLFLSFIRNSSDLTVLH